ILCRDGEGNGASGFHPGENPRRDGSSPGSGDHDHCPAHMKGRIYLSEDRGACALIAAALDVFSHQEEVPGAREVVLWAMETGMDWSRTGWLWPAGEGSGGRSVFYCGVSSGSPIVERSLCYLMPMLGGSPLQWEFVRLQIRAPRIRSWQGLLRKYSRLSQLIRDEMGH